jgi:predicted permease
MDKSFRTLVGHFLKGFLDRESPAEESEARTVIIQFLVCLSLPGLLLSFFLAADHPPGTYFTSGANSEFERMWMRSGDRYVFVCYAMCVIGLLMTYKWDSLFPDRRDYLILTPQPISSRRIFLAKASALVIMLAIVVAGINLFPLLIMPAVYSAKAHTPLPYEWALLSQFLGTVGGSIFAALAFASLQGILINVLRPAAFRRISPWIQTISMTLLFATLMVIPLAKELIRPLSQTGNSVLNFVPVIWFLGLFESFLPGGTLISPAYAWGKTALEATALACTVCAVSYIVGYHRYARRILEDEPATPAPGVVKRFITALLNRTILTNPFERAVFFFIGKVAARSSKHRLINALYIGGGAALALSSLFVINYRTPSLPRLSYMGVLQAPIILSFLIVTGLRVSFHVPYELRANWIFQISAGGNSPVCLRAIRKWIFFCRILPCYAVIAAGEFLLFPRFQASSHLIFDLCLSFLLIEVFFLGFNKVPFTCSYPTNKFQLAAIAAAYLYGFTMYVEIAGLMKGAITIAPPRMVVFLFVCFALFGLLAVLRSRRYKRLRVIYDEAEASVLTLSSDRGYWTATTALPVKQNYGNAAPAKATNRTVWTWTSIEQLFQDLRFGSRILWKSPGLSATAAILIALVIGGNTTVYSFVHSLITKPAPGVTGENLVTLSVVGQPADPLSAGFMDYVTLLNQIRTVNPLIGFRMERLTLAFKDSNWAFIGDSVTPNYFETLGVQFAKGRPFTRDENSLSSPGLAVILSFRVWQEQFHGVEDVVGRSVFVNGYPATIVGVTAGKFQGAVLGDVADLWVPLLALRNVNRSEFQIALMGKLAAGISASNAQAEFDTLATNLPLSANGGRPLKFTVRPYNATAWGGIQDASSTFLAVFSIITAITLFIGCATVANLMLSRAMEKQRETTVRLALGAPRHRILRTLLTEGVSVAVPAWILSSLISYWTTTTLPRLVSQTPDFRAPNGLRMNHLNVDFSPDWRVLGYAMLLALIAAVGFTVVPAIRLWRQELLPTLKSGEQGVAGRRSALSRTLVVAQLAFSVVLLCSAVTAYRSLAFLKIFDLPFDSRNLLLVTVNPSLNSAGRQTQLQLMERLRQRFRGIAGVSVASHVRLTLPYAGKQLARSETLKDGVSANINYVGPDYLTVLGVKPMLGREFTSADNSSPNSSALISNELASALWPGQSAVGQSLMLGPNSRSVEVIGVFSEKAVLTDRRSDDAAKDYVVLMPERQDNAPVVGEASLMGSGEITYYLRYSGDRNAVEAAVEPAIHNVDERIALVFMRTMERQLEMATFGMRPFTLLLTVFSTTSLIIAAIGQYAVVAFDMRRRYREFGVRLAIGASSRQIVREVLREGFMLSAVGLLMGFGLSLAMSISLRSFVGGSGMAAITAQDPATYSIVLTVLAAASLLACYLPARRASRVDPLTTLRCD